jgi:hypothetical protein
MAVIEGTAGEVREGSDVVGKLTSCTITMEQDTNTQGPFIGDPNTTTVRTGKSATVACEGVMETPTNAGQQAIIDAYAAGTDANITVEIDDPAEQTFACTTMIITSLEVGLDTGEGAPFSFEAVSNGAFTLTATP